MNFIKFFIAFGVALILGTYVLFSPRLRSKGTLEILAKKPGSFEIYEVDGDTNLLFVSKQLGQFNKELTLETGRYLVFSDCSHETIEIESNKKTTLITHQLIFRPPTEPAQGDIFSVQCNRHEKSFYRQSVSNRFEFQVLDGHREMLIGMMPFFIEPQKSQEPKTLEFPLSGVHFELQPGDFEKSPYFISPRGDLMAVTQPQNLGAKQFILPGPYDVWLNGSVQKLDLEPYKIHTMTPGFLSLTPPVETVLDTYTRIKGTPPSYEINENYRFFYHLTYPVLPGPIKVRLDGVQKPMVYDIKPGQKETIPMRSVTVYQGCSNHEWECLGKKTILISEKDQIYPYLESYTDVPVIYPKREDYLSLEGTKGIKFLLGQHLGSGHLNFSSGKILIKPKWITKHGYITDLVRIEALQTGFSGFSDDISVDRSSLLSLLAGQYHLSRYTSVSDNDRFATKQVVVIKPGETTVVEMPFYVSESKFLKFHQNLVKATSQGSDFLEESAVTF